ncbi:MAG: phosphate transport system regulatory protein PhoU [Rhodospirillales bacterium]|nr:MAG: phosphate transport system regulatory protein PhoU [Rhodospirillales bacterium]
MSWENLCREPDAVTTTHTLKSFDRELAELAALVREIGQMVVRQYQSAVTALLQSDRDAARQAIDADADIDDLEMRVHDEVLAIVVRYQPMAIDLRQVLAAERIASNLERIGDHAKNIAKRSLCTDSRMGAELDQMTKRMTDRVHVLLTDVLQAYEAADVDRARAVWTADAQLDELHDDLFHHILSEMQDGKGSIAIGTQLLFVAKSLERIGDHCTNIAEEVRFIVTGLSAKPRATDKAVSGD